MSARQKIDGEGPSNKVISLARWRQHSDFTSKRPTEVTFSVRSVFGRPIRFATRAAGQAFMRTHDRRANTASHNWNTGDYDDTLQALLATWSIEFGRLL